MSLGPMEIILILAVIVLLFGAGKLPRLMGDVAEGIKSFKKGMKDEGAPPSDKNKSDPV
jgi:sec-independent protein translocase protein TatA